MSTGLTSMRSMLASSTVHEDSVRKIRFTRRLGAADLAGLSGFDVTCHQLHEWVPKELAESGEVEPTLEALRILDDPGANAAAALVRRRGGVTGSPRPSVPLPGVAARHSRSCEFARALPRCWQRPLLLRRPDRKKDSVTELREYADDERPDQADQSIFAPAEDDDPEQYMTDVEIPNGLPARG